MYVAKETYLRYVQVDICKACVYTDTHTHTHSPQPHSPPTNRYVEDFDAYTRDRDATANAVLGPTDQAADAGPKQCAKYPRRKVTRRSPPAPQSQRSMRVSPRTRSSV